MVKKVDKGRKKSTEWRSEGLKGLSNNTGKRMKEKMCDEMEETA